MVSKVCKIEYEFSRGCEDDCDHACGCDDGCGVDTCVNDYVCYGED